MQHRLLYAALAVICGTIPAFAAPQIDSHLRMTHASFVPLYLTSDESHTAAGNLEIENAFTRPTLGGSTVAVGYMTIVNHGKSDDKLMAVASDISAKSELHESIMSGGVMEMRELPRGLVIPAGGTIAFKPGSYHVMFVGLKHAVKPGETIHATLIFERAGKVPANFLATTSPGATKPSSSMGDMGGMKMR